MIEGFSPIIGNSPKYLILGSAPSIKSLKESEYYGNKQNGFWTIISTIFNGPKLENYSEKIQFIKDNNILLWDVVKTCRRKGSLDSEIKDVEVNCIENLLITYKSIEKVVFNGKKAEQLYKRNINYYPSNVQFRCLPSSSPAHTMRIEEKIEIWKDFLL